MDVMVMQEDGVAVSPDLVWVLQAAVNAVLQMEGVAELPGEVGVSLVTDDVIQDLNQRYRQKDVPTDVLSFPMDPVPTPGMASDGPELMLGDIVISLDTATRQAAEYGHGLERELAFLAVHGTLHLLGYNHDTDEDQAQMRRREETALQGIGLPR